MIPRTLQNEVFTKKGKMPNEKVFKYMFQIDLI